MDNSIDLYYSVSQGKQIPDLSPKTMAYISMGGIMELIHKNPIRVINEMVTEILAGLERRLQEFKRMIYTVPNSEMGPRDIDYFTKCLSVVLRYKSSLGTKH